MQLLTIDTKSNCYVINPSDMEALQQNVATSLPLEKGTFDIQITEGTYSYNKNETDGEPLVLLWIYGVEGNTFTNKNTGLSVGTTWTTLHGYGDRLRSHKFTFHQYLKALGATPEDLKAPCPIPVLAFNQSLLTYTLAQSGTTGAALLGMIEYLYVDISAAIAQTLHQRQWALPGSQSHYAVHEKLDVEHAQELLTLAEPCWRESQSRTQVAQGLLLGAFYFWRLYDDLLQGHGS